MNEEKILTKLNLTYSRYAEQKLPAAAPALGCAEIHNCQLSQIKA
jgi:hypothetical protein